MVNHPNRRSRKAATAGVSARPAHNHDHDYQRLRFAVSASALRDEPIFTTDAEPAEMWLAFMNGLPTEQREHNCRACRHFIERFGGLVFLDGGVRSAMWSGDVPTFYQESFAGLLHLIKRAKVTGVFLSSGAVLGNPVTGTWQHIAAEMPRSRVYRGAKLTAGQAMAAKREDFATVSRALADWSADVIAEAVRLLKTETLARSDHFVAPMEWLLKLQVQRSEARGRERDHVLWYAIAGAPDGYCHPRSGMTGTLLDMVREGLPFGSIKAQWEEKVHPLRYQRPQAAPSRGNIAAAEKIVEKLGIGPSLERRFARLDDLQEKLWMPRSPKTKASGPGVFSHLHPDTHAVDPIDTPTVVMTWKKFAATALDAAEKIEIHMPGRRLPFITFGAPVHADAPPIFKWDRAESRNAIAWYLWHGGSSARDFGLTAGSWVEVTAICELPPMWGLVAQPHLGEGVAFILKGAVDTHERGYDLFPECLKPELHEVRSTIEAYARSAALVGREEASACGLDFRKGATPNYDVRVTVNGGRSVYRLDRWD